MLDSQSPSAMIATMAGEARAAAQALALLSTEQRRAGLRAAADALRAARAGIIAANAVDMERGAANGLTPAMLDRLRLDDARVAAMADGVATVATLDDPVGATIDEVTRPNGLVLRRVRVPIGVIGIIYESRPNVTADAAALCVMSGNAVVLRGGSEAVESNAAIHRAFVAGL
ncbi:MAG: gamma-glutamyl-phosphate reductase, partial [Sphingomonadales bacterium]|nr:gamma-glutamyl-phosphate reductase [Sphingomonadales bacterium]